VLDASFLRQWRCLLAVLLATVLIEDSVLLIMKQSAMYVIYSKSCVCMYYLVYCNFAVYLASSDAVSKVTRA